MDAFCGISKLYPELCALETCVKSNNTPVFVSGATGSQKNQMIYSLAKALGKKALVITSDEREASAIKEDLSTLFNADVPVFKSKEYVFYDVEVSTKESEGQRICAL